MEHIYISGFADEISSKLDEQINTMHDLGMSYLCLRSADGKNIGDYSLAEVETSILPRLTAANLKVSSIGSPIGKVFIDDEAGFEKQKTMLHELCKIAVACNTSYIRMFSFYIKEGQDYDSYTEQVIEKLQAFIEIAQQYNVILLHENEKDIYGDNAARCLTLMQRLSGPHFKAIFDFANFVQVKQDPQQAWDLLVPYIAYIHIKDASYDHNENVLCGTGDGQIANILQQAIQNGYQGFLTMEPHLVLFDALKDLELEDVSNIIKDDKGLNGPSAYKLQYDALNAILAGIH
ncbi:MAG: sugar phosphate isomerase/epimerase family protein [Erysipelotrichaceae bacterium]